MFIARNRGAINKHSRQRIKDYEADIKYLGEIKKSDAADYRQEILRLKGSINKMKQGTTVTDTDMKNSGLGDVIMQLIPKKYQKAASFLIPQVEEAVKKIGGDKELLEEWGVSVEKSLVPIPSVGCYIPGGQARYPSSVVMSVTPAKEAGVKRIVVVSPPGRDGKIDPLTIVAAKMCGATEIYKVGGAQAIGALAYGTKSIPKVDKIVGPGGKFVSIAKSLVSDQTAIDMVAGPTELGIIADASSDPELVALDLISQAEHSKDTMCFVITQSKTTAKQIQKSIEKLIPGTERSSIIKESISKNGFIAVCKNQNEVIELANKIAPEHMELMVKNARSFSKKITGAGLLLIGKNTPSAASDYLLGTNHILPTNGFGRTRGGLSVLDFSKLQTIVESKKSTLRKISKSLKALTDAEDLPNHYKAVKRRLD